MPALTLNIVTTLPRHEALEAVKQAVSTASGWIEGHQFYSNKAATLQTVIERGSLLAFLEKLAENHLVPDHGSTAQTLKAQYREGDTSEVRVACVLSFSADGPDLRIPVPAVPG